MQLLERLHGHVPAGRVIHVVVDNLNTHCGPAVAAWLGQHPGRVLLDFLPFYTSWLNTSWLNQNSSTASRAVCSHTLMSSPGPIVFKFTRKSFISHVYQRILHVSNVLAQRILLSGARSNQPLLLGNHVLRSVVRQH